MIFCRPLCAYCSCLGKEKTSRDEGLVQFNADQADSAGIFVACLILSRLHNYSSGCDMLFMLELLHSSRGNYASHTHPAPVPETMFSLLLSRFSDDCEGDAR